MDSGDCAGKPGPRECRGSCRRGARHVPRLSLYGGEVGTRCATWETVTTQHSPGAGGSGRDISGRREPRCMHLGVVVAPPVVGSISQRQSSLREAAGVASCTPPLLVGREQSAHLRVTVFIVLIYLPHSPLLVNMSQNTNSNSSQSNTQNDKMTGTILPTPGIPDLRIRIIGAG